MKIEAEIKDIDRDEVIDALAAQLLGADGDEDEDEDGEGRRYGRKPLGTQLRKFLERKIEELAATVVRQGFDDAIRARINAAVDVVLAEGWRKTNQYGEPTGTALDLKARVSELLTQHADSYNREPSLVTKRIDAVTGGFLDKEFRPIIDQAKATLKAKLDATVMETVAVTIKTALGLR